MRNDVTKRRLLIESKFPFEKASQIACSLEVTDKEISDLHNKNNQIVSNASNSASTVQFAKDKHKGGGKRHSKPGRFNAIALTRYRVSSLWEPSSIRRRNVHIKKISAVNMVKLGISLKVVEVVQ